MKAVNKKIVDKRLESTIEYLDTLQANYSKLNVIRIDLSYKKPYSDDITLDDANSEFNKMLNNRRGNSIFKDQVGYVCKKEYTKNKGVHFHTVFFYNGQKVKDDVRKAMAIGKYWNKQITDEKGSYHNCNLKADEVYKSKNAVGMLDHTDTTRREKLDEAISYLCKDDPMQDIAPVKSNSKDRAFVRGILPKKKSNSGRPRNK